MNDLLTTRTRTEAAALEQKLYSEQLAAHTTCFLATISPFRISADDWHRLPQISKSTGGPRREKGEYYLAPRPSLFVQ